MFCEGNHIIFIGAQKAGTTWFQHVLDSDSRASTSVAQEVKYLNREGRLEFDEYCSYFSNGSGASASVDVTPAYLTSTRVLPTLKAFYNEYNFKPKIVVCLREPVRRAFSAYQMFLNYGRQLGEFIDNLQQDCEIYEKSLYGKYLQNWVNAGWGPYMHIILFDDIVEKPYEVLESLTKFIGFDSLLSDAYVGNSINVGGLDKLKALSVLRQRAGKILRSVGMHGSIHALKRNAFIKWLDNANKSRIVLDSDSEELARKMFEDDVDQLDHLFPDLNAKSRWGYGTSA